MRFRRFAAFLLALILLSGTCFAVGEDYGTFGDELTQEQYEFIYNEKNYSFSIGAGVVVVALKKGVTVDDADFPELDIRGIETLNSEMYANGEMENLVLMLRINAYSRQEIVSAINVLKGNHSVLYAEPFYTFFSFDTYQIAQASGVRIKGDVNFDGTLNNLDVIILARYIVRLTSFTYSQIQCADLNGDRKINNTDLLLLAKMVVGIK